MLKCLTCGSNESMYSSLSVHRCWHWRKHNVVVVLLVYIIFNIQKRTITCQIVSDVFSCVGGSILMETPNLAHQPLRSIQEWAVTCVIQRKHLKSSNIIWLASFWRQNDVLMSFDQVCDGFSALLILPCLRFHFTLKEENKGESTTKCAAVWFN